MDIRALNSGFARRRAFWFVLALIIIKPGWAEQESWQNTSVSYVGQAEELRLLAEGGDPETLTRLAVMYERGVGVPQSFNKAIKLYRKAAGQKYEPALIKLRSLGVPVIPIPQTESNEKKLDENASRPSTNITIRIGNTHSTQSTFGLELPRTFIVAWPRKKRFRASRRSVRRNQSGFSYGAMFPNEGVSRSGRLGKRSVSGRPPFKGG